MSAPRYAAAALAATLLASPAVALDASTWERDAQLVENGLMRTLDESFQRTREKEDWIDFIVAYEQGLARFDGMVDPGSMTLLREMSTQARQLFESTDEDERWQDASYYIRQKTVFTTFVMRSFSR